MPSLRQDFGLWRLCFDNRQAVLKHEVGLAYAAYLLAHPGPIHGLDLFARVRGAQPNGRTRPDGRVQERSLAGDDLAGMRALRRRQLQLEALLEDEAAAEPVRAEAAREVEAITRHLRARARRTEDAAQKTVRSVRRALQRLHARLLRANDSNGNPHPVLRPFGQHLGRCLLIPSARGERAGTFTYEPPAGVRWT